MPVASAVCLHENPTFDPQSHSFHPLPDHYILRSSTLIISSSSALFVLIFFLVPLLLQSCSHLSAVIYCRPHPVSHDGGGWNAVPIYQFFQSFGLCAHTHVLMCVCACFVLGVCASR